MARAATTAGYAALLLALTLPAGAAEKPSFDCAKAGTATEKAICANGRLARLDRAIAKAWRALKDDFGELKDEQTAFLAQRDACGADVACLSREMESWRAALALEPLKSNRDVRERWVGRYKDEVGEMVIRRTLKGEYELSGNSGDPNGRWVCDVGGPIRPVKKGVAIADVGEEKDPYTVTLKLAGNVLIVAEDEDKRLMGYTCGHNGTVDGRYRRAAGKN
jgi:uncharacterized protein YecT (DUF1311 family)